VNYACFRFFEPVRFFANVDDSFDPHVSSAQQTKGLLAAGLPFASALFAPGWNSYSRRTSPYVFTRELLVGSVVSVNNKHGTELSARVVAQLAALEGVSTYAIEFVEQDERAETFWGIIFPPNTSTA
jgi:hypothetical protein